MPLVIVRPAVYTRSLHLNIKGWWMFIVWKYENTMKWQIHIRSYWLTAFVKKRVVVDTWNAIWWSYRYNYMPTNGCLHPPTHCLFLSYAAINNISDLNQLCRVVVLSGSTKKIHFNRWMPVFINSQIASNFYIQNCLFKSQKYGSYLYLVCALCIPRPLITTWTQVKISLILLGKLYSIFQ